MRLQRISAALAAGVIFGAAAHAAESGVYRGHGIAMHGDLEYRADFEHFDYANPAAPKGGEMKQAAIGTFDSFNPFIIRGTPRPGSARSTTR